MENRPCQAKLILSMRIHNWLVDSERLSLFVHILNKAFVLVTVNEQNDWLTQFLEISAEHIGGNTEFVFPLRLALDLSVPSKKGVGELQKAHGRDQRTTSGPERLQEMM